MISRNGDMKEMRNSVVFIILKIEEDTTNKQSIRTAQPTRCDFSQWIYFCKTLYMFQTVFPSIIRSSKLHIQRQVFVRPILLPAASLAGLTLFVQFW